MFSSPFSGKGVTRSGAWNGWSISRRSGGNSGSRPTPPGFARGAQGRRASGRRLAAPRCGAGRGDALRMATDTYGRTAATARRRAVRHERGADAGGVGNLARPKSPLRGVAVGCGPREWRGPSSGSSRMAPRAGAAPRADPRPASRTSTSSRAIDRFQGSSGGVGGASSERALAQGSEPDLCALAATIPRRRRLYYAAWRATKRDRRLADTIRGNRARGLAAHHRARPVPDRYRPAQQRYD